jgi:hypothetical protein
MKYKVVFKRLPPNLLGTYSYKTKTITIDLGKDDRAIGYVFVHEQFHALNPGMPEDEVTARAWIHWKRMTRPERLKLLRKLFRRKGDG